MSRFSLSAVGVDRPGIVAAVTGVLVDLGCNIEDSTMSILQGHFAILLVVSAPAGVPAAALEEALAPVAERFGLLVVVRSFEEVDEHGGGGGAGADGPARRAEPVEGWTISVHGADRPGIVHGVASTLAEVGGNVIDLTTHLVGAPSAPVYVMTLRATLPAGAPGAAAAAEVRRSAEVLGVQCTVQRDEAELL
jgi:glycine cleavage system transcriptional repressor